jgi:hypothetical protein
MVFVRDRNVYIFYISTKEPQFSKSRWLDSANRYVLGSMFVALSDRQQEMELLKEVCFRHYGVENIGNV